MNTSENTGEDVPFDLSKAAAAATEELLPSKSKERYEKQFQIFEDWRRLKNVTSLTEDVFLAYFAEKSSSYKASSLWSTYSMLKAVLLLKENLDISKFCKVTAYLKRKSTGYQPKKSKCLSRDQIDKFLLEAPDKEFLLMKVALIFGVSGACRCDELSRMLVDDIEDQNNVLIVHIPDSKTKKPRRFVVVDERNLATYRRYLELRPPSIPHKRLFLNYKKGKCTVQPVGLHSFGKFPSQIATYLGLPTPLEYTGHCMRRSSATLLVDAGGDITNLKRHGGWQSSSVAEGYIEESIENKLDIANKIQAGPKKRPFTNIETCPSTSSDSSEICCTEISTEIFDKNWSKEFRQYFPRCRKLDDCMPIVFFLITFL
ncbi:hypothetical protein Zmor_006183 [Zophobas morio]|uniref:Tyr recombinase domain-containing protein n=1 Tax=Zophobas morio TaxID=2755281 RepID=A0AA38IUG7_9CUCU|nr:hypothetical protein Zmor_006183 [Zophobas morio]